MSIVWRGRVFRRADEVGTGIAHSGGMKTLDVPEVLTMPEDVPNKGSAGHFADMMLTSLFGRAPSMLYAEYHPRNRMVTWFLRPLSDDSDQPGLPAGATDFSTGFFRAVLARFGHLYMNEQLYGGHQICVLRQRGREHRCQIFMSNNGQSGYWIRIYAAAVSDADEKAD